MAQEPETAAYDGMPRSAIATGVVDFILPPEKMPEPLIAYARQAFGHRPGPAVSAPPQSGPDFMQKVFILLRAQTGHDFSHYKKNTIQRRVERRMAVAQIDRVEDYVRYLRDTPLEVDALFRELLIGVTSFFRDPGAFEALEERVIRGLSVKEPEEFTRIWVPGCSTGEEAYTIAILVQEHRERQKQALPTQIFATDIDAEAVEKARAGVYPDSIAADISAERLGRFFAKEDSAYRVAKGIRDMVVFAKQDVLKDPPFAKLDLISCRNLLIYLGGEAQKKVLQMFHYSLNRDGHLFLGNSETVGDFTDLFGALGNKWKIYRRKGEARYRIGITPFIPAAGGTGPFRGIATAADPVRPGATRDLAEQVLLEAYIPASVLINPDFDVLYIHGRTGKYLEPAPGDASLNLLQMAREGLRMDLAAAARKALAEKTSVRREGLRVKSNGDVSIVNLIVHPVTKPDAARGLLMVLFGDAPPVPVPATEDGVVPPSEQEQRLIVLERELRTKGEYLQTVIEELDTTNEELVTVNTELQNKIEELSRANSDMNNLLAGTNIGTLFVGHNLLIQRFTPAAVDVIKLIRSDIGRPLGDIVPRLAGYDLLVDDVQAVLDTLIPKETEVRTEGGRYFQMRIQPYRTLQNVIEGAVLTFVDISEQKELRAKLADNDHRHREAIEKIRRTKGKK